MHFIIWILGSLLGKTWRIKLYDPYNVDIFNDREKKRIYCFWHEHLLPVAFHFRDSEKTALVSLSNDGRIAAEIARKWGHDIIAGSSSRGGTAAFRQCLRQLKNNCSLAITPDGPRGPRRKAKDGVAQIAQHSGAPVIAIRVTANRFWRLHSWDGFCIPKPFARVTFTLEKPLLPPGKKAPPESVTKFRYEIEKSLENYGSMA
jgi:Kdo2-lipid IVA 3' secondary acyltransferase